MGGKTAVSLVKCSSNVEHYKPEEMMNSSHPLSNLSTDCPNIHHQRYSVRNGNIWVKLITTTTTKTGRVLPSTYQRQSRSDVVVQATSSPRMWSEIIIHFHLTKHVSSPYHVPMSTVQCLSSHVQDWFSDSHRQLCCR